MRFSTCATAALFIALASSSAHAAEPRDRFGSDWDDPRTAEPAVERPDTRVCTVDIVRHGFADFEPYRNLFTPPADCAGPWHKVVLDLEGSVKGRQYDRMGLISIGGVTVLRTSTPEPSREGIRWHVEKDVSAYAPLLHREQPVVMELGNLVNETYTGIFDIRATLSFYMSDARHPALDSADSVQPLDNAHRVGADLAGGFVLPIDTRRLVAEVYANGSGGGCEEFWYLTANQEGYSCRAEHGPYREVQVLVDGKIAGLAAPYPHIYTGGWSNPFLWYAIPAPQTFDLRPQRFDLSPFIGLLNDGKPHELRVRVIGLAPDAAGWTLLPQLHVWRNAQGRRTRGALTGHRLEPLVLNHPIHGEEGGHRLEVEGAHRLHISGWVDDGSGREQITIEYDIGMQGTHRWSRDESDDRLQAQWRDRQRITRQRDGETPLQHEQVLDVRLDGGIRTAPESGHPRLTTDLVIEANEAYRDAGDGRDAQWIRIGNRFEGEAAYTQEVPREQRRATGNSRQIFSRQDSEGRCWSRRIATTNGWFTEDSTTQDAPAHCPH